MQRFTDALLRGGDIEISRIAYRLWGAAGRPPGRYMEFWPQAEQEFKNMNYPPSETESPNPAHGELSLPAPAL